MKSTSAAKVLLVFTSFSGSFIANRGDSIQPFSLLSPQILTLWCPLCPPWWSRLLTGMCFARETEKKIDNCQPQFHAHRWMLPTCRLNNEDTAIQWRNFRFIAFFFKFLPKCFTKTIEEDTTGPQLLHLPLPFSSLLAQFSIYFTFDPGLTVTLDVNICKDHRDKIEVPDPLAVEDLIRCKLNNKRKLARLITQYRDIFFSNISGGTGKALLLQGITESHSL